MLSTPKPGRLGRPSLGEPNRMARSVRDQSPGALSVDSLEEPSASRRPMSGMTGGSLSRHGKGAPGRNSRDPRPIGDKAYASQCARNVVDFLAARGFGRMISHDKFLREPMTKDFFDIFKFLIAQLDPQLEIEGKMEDEVPPIMKRLKYPVEVNRSKLQCINGPNTWPQLLGVLEWLIALIQVNDALIEPVAECNLGLSEEVDCETDHQMLRTLHESYLHFLSGKDDNSVEERLRRVYEERLDALNGEIDRLQDQTNGMEAQVIAFREEHDRLLELQSEPKRLAIEADRLRSGIQAQDARAERLEEETVTVEAEERALLVEVDDLEGKSKQLQELVEKQAYSKKDIERLKHERKHLRQMLENLKADAEKADQAVWELGIEESGLEEAISRMVRSVNDKAEAVEAGIAVVGGPCAEELKVHVDLTEPTDALNALDFNDKGERVEEAITAHGEATRREEVAVDEVAKEQRVMHDDLVEKEREIRRLKDRLEQMTRRREEYRVWSDSALDDARRTVAAAEDALRAASIGSAAPSLTYKAQVDELRLQLSDLNKRREADNACMEEKIRREQETRDQHQQNVQKEMRMAVEAAEKLREDVEKKVADMGTEAEIRHSPSRGGS